MLLIVDLALVGLIVFALWLAAWRGRARARRARTAAAATGAADLVPAHAVQGHAAPAGDRPRPRVVVDPGTRRSTWSASVDRGETAPPAPPAPPARTRTRVGRPAVVVAPRGSAWVVRRDGASRVSSVHDSREAAEARARKTARRERVMLEIRDEDAAVIESTDFSSDRRAVVRADGAMAPRS